jgi:hypothetical protein
MKALLVAIQPKWLKMILEGEKKFEFRSWKVPVGTVIYFYCTKAKPYLWYEWRYADMPEQLRVSNRTLNDIGLCKENLLNGKVVAKAVVKNVYEIGVADRPFYDKKTTRSWSELETFTKEEQEKMGIPFETGFFSWRPISVNELTPYGYTDQRYAIKLSQVEEIEPMDITEFSNRKYCGNTPTAFTKNLTKPPQSRTWVFING